MNKFILALMTALFSTSAVFSRDSALTPLQISGSADV